MKGEFSRRNFLKAAGVGAAALVLPGCSEKEILVAVATTGVVLITLGGQLKKVPVKEVKGIGVILVAAGTVLKVTANVLGKPHTTEASLTFEEASRLPQFGNEVPIKVQAVHEGPTYGAVYEVSGGTGRYVETLLETKVPFSRE